MASLLAHAGLAATTALAWLGLGTVVLARGPHFDDRPLELLNRVGVGALTSALLTFAAGWAHLLYRAVYIPFLVASTLIGAVAALRVGRAAVPRRLPVGWAPWEKAVAVLLLFFVAIAIVAVSAPVSSPDALLYHLADPALFDQAHRIYEIPWNSSSYEPFSVEMLVLDGLLLWNPVQGAYAPLLLSLLALGAVLGLAYRLSGRRLALLAGAVFFAQPLMVWEATSTFIESGIAAMVALAAWNIVVYSRTGRTGAIALAGVFAGGAAGMKYLGLIAACVLGGACLVVILQRRGRRIALAFALPAVGVALPWYLKNAILTGNPFYPHLFGGLNSSAARELSYTMQSFGYGHSFGDFLLLPVRLLVSARPFDGGQYLSPLFLIFAPVAVLLLPRRRDVVLAAAAVGSFVIVWFLTTQQARFLVPAMPVAAVLAAAGAAALIRAGRIGRLVAVGVTTGVLAVAVGASAVYTAQFAPVVFGHETTDRFLREKVSDFTGVEWLNRNLPRDATVATDVWALFYLKMRYVTFGTMGDLLPPDADAPTTREFVARYGITNVAIIDNDGPRRRQMRYLRARLIARVPVRSVQSRSRGRFGPVHQMLVYSVSS